MTLGSLLANASESATQVSGTLTPAARAAEDGAHKHSSDVLVVRGRKHGTQAGNHDKWVSYPLVRLAGDENMQKTVIAEDLVHDLLENASGSSMES